MEHNPNTPVVTTEVTITESIRKADWGTVLRDAVLITALTGFVGFILRLILLRDTYSFLWAISISNMILLPVGFTASGCFAMNGRFRHLYKVAFVVWIFGLINVAYGVATLANWVFSVLSIFISMGIGGGLSFLIIRPGSR